jgi:hypothetical protein
MIFDIRKSLREELDLASFRLPQQVDVSDEELRQLRAINWDDIQIEDLGGQGNIAYLKVGFPFNTAANEGIIVDIQVLGGQIYQPHIHLPKNLQRLGLGYKIYKKLIADFGHLYSGKGRRMNPNIDKIWAALKADGSYNCLSNTNGDMCMSKTLDDPTELVKFMQ